MGGINRHIIWLQENGRNLADRARGNFDAFLASGDTDWAQRASHDQRVSASQYAEARRWLIEQTASPSTPS